MVSGDVLETRERIRIEVIPDNGWLSVEQINFHGRSIRSTNNRWILLHGQVLDHGASSWSSDDPTGVAILFDRGAETCRLDSLSRPETLALSNAGVFAVNEWGPSYEFLGPRCRLRAFTSDGNCIFEHRSGAAMDLPAISADGRYLAWHTLSAPRESARPEDGASVFLVDLHGPTFLWQRPVPIVWPKRITFDEGAQHVVVHPSSNEGLRYTYTGEFLDSEMVEGIELRSALADERGYSLFNLACARVARTPLDMQSDEQVQEIENLIRTALEKQMSPNTKARAHRLFGEIAEHRGDGNLALAQYRAAIALNPKIGLKKKVKSLELQTGSKE